MRDLWFMVAFAGLVLASSLPAFAYDARQGNLACADCHPEGTPGAAAAPVAAPPFAASLAPLRLAATGASAWSAVQNLSNTPAASGLCSNNAKAVVVDSEGKTHAVWWDKATGSAEIYHSLLSPGRQWTTPERLTEPDGKTSAYASLAADSQGRVFLVWEDYFYTTGFWPKPEVFLRVWNGSSWGNLTVVSSASPGTDASWYPAVAVGSDDQVHILWQDRREGALTVYRSDGAQEFGKLADGSRPSVGAAGGRVLAAWETPAGGVEGRELPAGALQTFATSGAFASVHANGAGTGFAVWNTPAGDVGYAAFEDGAWGASGEAGLGTAPYPSVAVDPQGKAHVAFGYGALAYATCTQSTWTSPEVLESSNAGLPILAAGGNALHLAYIGTGSGNSEIYYRNQPLEARNPVLFIPGFMASKLYEGPRDSGDDLVWVSNLRFLSIGDAFLDPLEMDTGGGDRLGFIGTYDHDPGSVLPPTPENWDAPLFASRYYAAFFNAIVAAGYSPSAGTQLGDFTYFAYDWRRAPDEDALQQDFDRRVQDLLAANPGATQVDVVTHSTGGLVLKPYLAAHSAQIGKVIEIAAPHLGVARGFRALQFGQIELGWLADLVINENEIMKIAQNWLGPYALAPSQAFFTQAGYEPIFTEVNVDLDNNGAFETWDWDRINSWYHNGFYDWNWYTTPTRATENPHNGARADKAIAFHTTYDPLSGWLAPDRNVAFFVGQNRATLQSLDLSLWNPLDPNWPNAWTVGRHWMGGDGTVPTRSASVDFDTSRPNVARYYVWDVEHSEILNDADVAAAVTALLRDRPPPLPEGKIQRDKPFRDTLTLWEIIFRCPLEVHVYDPGGNHTGPTGDREIETDVPGVQYERTSAPDGYVTTILLPQGKPYDLLLVAKGTGQFRLTVHKIDDDAVTRTVLYDRVPLQPATTGTFALTAAGDLGVLRVDVNGDNQDIRTVPVTAVLTGDERADRDPPVTSLALSGTPGLNGYYVSDVNVTFSATDGLQGSGVRLTQYRLGSGSSWTLFEGPLSLHQACVIPLQYRSQDLNYNLEAAQETSVKIDQIPPTVGSFTISPAQLWPPNHTMVEVTPTAVLTDDCTSAVGWAIESIRMNEGDRESTFDPVHDQWLEQGFTSADIQVLGGKIYLRAERKGNGGGRVYTLTLKAVDDAGNVTRADAQVVVPHDQR